MTPEVRDFYDELLEKLRDAIDEDPDSEKTKALRALVSILDRIGVGSTADPISLSSATLH